MRMRVYDILDGIESATECRAGTVAIFGEGRTAIQASIDNEGKLRIYADDAILILPRASNTIHVRTEGDDT